MDCFKQISSRFFFFFLLQLLQHISRGERKSASQIGTLLAYFKAPRAVLPTSESQMRWDRLLLFWFCLRPCPGDHHGILFSLLIWNAWCPIDSFWWCLMACKCSNTARRVHKHHIPLRSLVWLNFPMCSLNKSNRSLGRFAVPSWKCFPLKS